MAIEVKIRDLEKSANEAYLNSISLELAYSTDPRVKTRTSEAKRYAKLRLELRKTKFALECKRVEDSLPNFKKMSLSEICTWAEGADNMLHWCPCAVGEEEVALLHEDGRYYLAVMRYSEDGWPAEARGVRITHRLVKVLAQKGLRTVEYLSLNPHTSVRFRFTN